MDGTDYTQRQIRDLEALLEVSRAMGATTDLDDLLIVITEQAARMLDAERASLFLYDREAGVLRSRVAQGTDEIEFPADQGIAGAVVHNRQIENIPDAYADSRFNREIDRQTGYRTRSLLALPLFGYDGELVGVLEVLNRRAGPFEAYDVKIATALSEQAGVALQRARLREHYEEKLRMEQALEIARGIQAELLPGKDPEVPGYDIVGWNRSSDQVGGDCYDFFPLPDGRWAIGLGDATGHGVGPALISGEARATLRGLASATGDLHRIMNLANRLLAEDLSGARFVTMFFGLLDAARDRMDFASAGQAPILFYDAAAGTVRSLGATGVPLGLMGDVDIPPAEPLTFRTGDVLVLLTDGFYEWENADGEQFGEDRVCDVLRRHAGGSSGQILRAILGSLYTFTDSPQADDLTAVLVRKR